MNEVLQQGGRAAQFVFIMALGGIPLVVFACGWWRIRQNLEIPALRAATEAKQHGLDPLAQYQAGRDAALKATQPVSAFLLGAAILAWATVLTAMALLTFLKEPSVLMVTDLLRGNLSLPTHMPQNVYMDLVVRSLVLGGLVTFLVVPVLITTGLSLGFLRSWLLGAPLDRVLLKLLEQVDPGAVDPRLQDLADGIKTAMSRRWTLTGLLLAPVWFLGRKRHRVGLLVLLAWLGSLGLGLLFWYLGARFIFGGENLLQDTTASVIWFYSRSIILVLFSLPVFYHVGTRGNR